jgi:alpha,alpha-trehalase
MSDSVARVEIDPTRFDAAIFDMDGVITQTATVHAAAWKQLFDQYRDRRIQRGLPPFAPFDPDEDYRLYVDGRPRYDGVRAFLASRSISLPPGDPADPPGGETVCGLGNMKDAFFWERIHRDGVQAYASTLALIRKMKEHGVRVGVFSASRNAAAVLRTAGVLELFDQKVDGTDNERLRLPGKPDPAMLLELTRRLGADRRRTIVFEDAIAGVEAGRAGGFGLVIGVNRKAETGELIERGADREVRDLSEVVISG